MRTARGLNRSFWIKAIPRTDVPKENGGSWPPESRAVTLHRLTDSLGAPGLRKALEAGPRRRQVASAWILILARLLCLCFMHKRRFNVMWDPVAHQNPFKRVVSGGGLLLSPVSSTWSALPLPLPHDPALLCVMFSAEQNTSETSRTDRPAACWCVSGTRQSSHTDSTPPPHPEPTLSGLTILALPCCSLKQTMAALLVARRVATVGFGLGPVVLAYSVEKEGGLAEKIADKVSSANMPGPTSSHYHENPFSVSDWRLAPAARMLQGAALGDALHKLSSDARHTLGLEAAARFGRSTFYGALVAVDYKVRTYLIALGPWYDYTTGTTISEPV